MAKKKAQHLYELLGQKTREAQQSADARAKEASAVAPQPGGVHDAGEPQRRRVPAPPPPVMMPAPAGPGRESALENVITIRRDTAIVGTLLIIVLLAVSFALGRATAPRQMPQDEEEPPMALRTTEYVLILKTYSGGVEGLEEVAKAKEFIKKRGYEPAEEIIGNQVRLIVPGFKSKNDEKATKALGELSNMIINGEKPFAKAHFK